MTPRNPVCRCHRRCAWNVRSHAHNPGTSFVSGAELQLPDIYPVTGPRNTSIAPRGAGEFNVDSPLFISEQLMLCRSSQAAHARTPTPALWSVSFLQLKYFDYYTMYYCTGYYHVSSHLTSLQLMAKTSAHAQNRYRARESQTKHEKHRLERGLAPTHLGRL